MTPTRLWAQFSALLLCSLLMFGLGCGRYGKPVRTYQPKPEALRTTAEKVEAELDRGEEEAEAAEDDPLAVIED